MRQRIALGALLLAQGALLWAASHFGDFTIAGHARLFVSLLLIAGLCFVGAVLLFERIQSPSPAGFSPKAALGFWAATIALRLVMLGTEPGDDLWRYLWEGRIQTHGVNPYLIAPAAAELAPLRDENWARINHRQWAAIYPPATELVFGAIASQSASVFAFKAVFISADLLTVWLLIGLCSHRLAPAAWFAWNPAVIYAFAGSAHSDSLMLLAMTAAVSVLDRATSHHERHSQPASVSSLRWNDALLSCGLLGLAIAFKLVPIFLIPAWVGALRRKSAALLLSLAIPIGLAIPYGGVATAYSALGRFADITRFNDLIWWSIEALTIPNPFQRNWPFTLALGSCILFVGFRFRYDWRRCLLWSIGLTLVLSPTLHPWYATWILPIACWRRVPAWTILSLSALCALLLWESTALWEAWQPNFLTRMLVILPPLLAWRWQRSFQTALPLSNPVLCQPQPESIPI